MANQASGRSVLIYDGECGFCKRCVNAWKEITGNRFSAEISQKVGPEFSQVPSQVFQQSVVFVLASGEYFTGAQAVFRSLAQDSELKWAHLLLWAYERSRGFARICEWLYRSIAQNRVFFSRVSLLLWGEDLRPSTYRIAQKIFLSFLGLIYLIAFISLKTQILGLVGSHGILTSNLTDFQLQLLCWVGIAGAGLLMLGIAQIFSLIVLLIVYFLFIQICQSFLGFQWDGLLLEMGFLAIFLRSQIKERGGLPSRGVLFLLRWLLFRVMFFSGWVKLASGDPHWRDGTALNFHFETQPLPTWVGWYFHQLPGWVHQGLALGLFGVELGIPFLIFLPRKAKIFAFFVFFGFQAWIGLTGNYGFFGLQVVALSILLLDDRAWAHFFVFFKSQSLNHPSKSSGLRRQFDLIFVPLIFLASLFPGSMVGRTFGAFGLVNSYGVFATMTTHRDEIEIQTSQDGKVWVPLEFRWKPGRLDESPGFVEPHMPRLDWLMWFAAMGDFDENPWLQSFLVRLLEGSPEVFRLLKPNSLMNESPLWVRAVHYRYHFTNLETKQATGNWWSRVYLGEYSPTFARSLK